MKKNGFTLIELLAVIVILSILMVLAVTSFTTVMNNSKKDTMITTAEQFVDAVEVKLLSGDFDDYDILENTNGCLVVRINSIELESGNYDSPFGSSLENNYSYVVVKHIEGIDYDYYVQLVDDDKNGFRITTTNSLRRDIVLMGNVNNAIEVKNNADGSMVDPSNSGLRGGPLYCNQVALYIDK